MMRIVVGVLLCLVFLVGAMPVWASDENAKFEVGTIGKIQKHQEDLTKPNAENVRYDIEVQVGEMIYVVLLTTDETSASAPYASGKNVMVSVGRKTITFKDMLGRTKEVPILSSQKVPPPKPTE